MAAPLRPFPFHFGLLSGPSQEQLRGYSRLYDLSRSERSKVHELAVTMATDGQPLQSIRQLLHIALGQQDLSVKSVLQDAVARVVAVLRYPVI